jgi:hypothetical protein
MDARGNASHVGVSGVWRGTSRPLVFQVLNQQLLFCLRLVYYGCVESRFCMEQKKGARCHNWQQTSKHGAQTPPKTHAKIVHMSNSGIMTQIISRLEPHTTHLNTHINYTQRHHKHICSSITRSTNRSRAKPRPHMAHSTRTARPYNLNQNYMSTHTHQWSYHLGINTHSTI